MNVAFCLQLLQAAGTSLLLLSHINVHVMYTYCSLATSSDKVLIYHTPLRFHEEQWILLREHEAKSSKER